MCLAELVQCLLWLMESSVLLALLALRMGLMAGLEEDMIKDFDFSKVAVGPRAKLSAALWGWPCPVCPLSLAHSTLLQPWEGLGRGPYP